jgi:hypothetical protein
MLTVAVRATMSAGLFTPLRPAPFVTLAVASFGRATVVAASETWTFSPFRRRSFASSLSVESRPAPFAVAWGGVELLECLGGLRDLVRRDFTIAVGVERLQQRGSEVARRTAGPIKVGPSRTVPIGTSIAGTSAFTVRPAPASRFARPPVSLPRRTGTISLRSCVFRFGTIAGSSSLFCRRGGTPCIIDRRIGKRVGSGPGRHAAQQRGQQECAHRFSLNRGLFAQRKNSAARR